MMSTDDYLDFELAQIFKETRAVSNSKYSRRTRKLKRDTLVYDSAPDYAKSENYTTEIEFVTGGTVEVAYQLTDTLSCTAILNFADALTPGGLVLVGGTTQEENICRCTNLYESLTQKSCTHLYYDYNRSYPGVYSDRLIYSPDVLVFRDDKTYDFVSPKKVDVITCPAPSTSLDSEEALCIYQNRIKAILDAAVDNCVDNIVLGAWGCGAFHQNPVLVANAFAQVLNEYAGCFDRVVFAIRATPGEESNGTMNTFIKAFGKFYKGEVNTDAV